MDHYHIYCESPEQFPDTLRALEEDLQPRGALERMLVRQMAEAMCRMARANMMEAALIDLREPYAQLHQAHEHLPEDRKAVLKLGAIIIEDSRYHKSPLSKVNRMAYGAERRFHAALKALHQLRKLKPPPAPQIHERTQSTSKPESKFRKQTQFSPEQPEKAHPERLRPAAVKKTGGAGP
jgi:hypothetical protein